MAVIRMGLLHQHSSDVRLRDTMNMINVLRNVESSSATLEILCHSSHFTLSPG